MSHQVSVLPGVLIRHCMAEERATAAERRCAEDADERERGVVTDESRTSQAAAEVQALKSQLQKLQAAHRVVEEQWEAQRVAGAVATASALDEASRWEAEAARWEAEAVHWEAEARDQAEQLKVLQRQHKREIDSLLDEFCDTEDGYRKVVEKQRKARHRAERKTEAAESALFAVQEVAEAELSKLPEDHADAETALDMVQALARQRDGFQVSSPPKATVEHTLPAQTAQFQATGGTDAHTHRPYTTGDATSLQLFGLGLGAVPTVASPMPPNRMRVGGTGNLEGRPRQVRLIHQLHDTFLSGILRMMVHL